MFNIHLGPHKTATTYIQKTLAGSRWKPGFRYFTLREHRQGGLSRALRESRGVLPPQMADSALTYILSDENLIGDPRSPGKVYPRIRQDVEWMKGHKAHVLMALRPYHELLVSGWVQVLRHYPFTEFPGVTPTRGRGYLDVLADLERGAEPGRITLWRYSDFRKNSARIIRTIAADGISELVEPTSEVYASPSMNAISLYRKLVPLLSVDDQVKAFRIIEGEEALASGARLNLLDEGEVRRLSDRFEADLEVIRSRYGLWSPEMEPRADVAEAVG